MSYQPYFIERGTGFPLILLHGNGQSTNYFVHQMDFFAPRYRVIAIDTRGHGKSPRGDSPYDFRQFAEDLHDFMDSQGIEKAHLLGFSDGGNIALTFALRYPERVEKLILNGANLSPWGVPLHTQLPIVLTYWKLAVPALFDPKARAKRERFNLMVHHPHIDPADLAGLTLRTLVIAGEHDMIADRHTRKIHRSLPNAKLVILPGDHFIASKNSEQFNREVQEFLDEPDPA